MLPSRINFRLGGGKKETRALTTSPVTVYTAGSAPTVTGNAVTVANSATPTVVELLLLVAELTAKVNAITTALKA